VDHAVGIADPSGSAGTANLTGRLTLGDPDTRRGIDHVGVALALRLPGAIVETTRDHGLMEEALLDLHRNLPHGVRLAACISCAFSDYHPAGSGFIGTMACFRDAKDDYRAVSGKSELFQVWDRLSGFVQETFACTDFEQRRPGAGYRGWPSM
jgi:hypothetical protein